MKQELMLSLPARKNVPATNLFVKIYTESNKFGERDVLLMIPGGPGNDYSMYDAPEKSIAMAMLPFVDVILFDPRGCGRSEHSEIQYCSLENYIDDIESIRVQLDLSQENLVVFGQSYGSIAALGYAIKYPTQLKKLLLIAGAASSEALIDAEKSLLKIGNPQQIAWGEKIWSGTFSGTEQEVIDYYHDMAPLYSTSYQPGGPAPKITYNVHVLNYGFSDFLKRFDFRSQLNEVKCPTLLLWGEDDWLLDQKQASIIHRGIPQSQLILYQRCGHLLWVDQWDRFVKDASEFLQS